MYYVSHLYPVHDIGSVVRTFHVLSQVVDNVFDWRSLYPECRIRRASPMIARCRRDIPMHMEDFDRNYCIPDYQEAYRSPPFLYDCGTK